MTSVCRNRKQGSPFRIGLCPPSTVDGGLARRGWLAGALWPAGPPVSGKSTAVGHRSTAAGKRMNPGRDGGARPFSSADSSPAMSCWVTLFRPPGSGCRHRHRRSSAQTPAFAEASVSAVSFSTASATAYGLPPPAPACAGAGSMERISETFWLFASTGGSEKRPSYGRMI